MNDGRRLLVMLLPALALAACTPAPPQALGTLEWERIVVPAPAAETILEISVYEGQRVEAGTLLLRLDDRRQQARLDLADARVEQLRASLAELEAGPRQELRAEARARVDAAASRARNAAREFERTAALVARGLLGAAELDRSRAARDAAAAETRAQRESQAALDHGSRVEQLQQARAALHAAEAERVLATLELQRLALLAPRAGRIDSLPYKLGDQPPLGAPLVVLLAGAPHARIYVPAPLRAGLQPGQAVALYLQQPPAGLPMPLRGSLRNVASEPSFTPYFSLTGSDAARLSYLAEVTLEPLAADLPAGLALRAEFGAVPPP